MFTIQKYVDSFILHDTRNGNNLHSDGSVYKTAEYFPTLEVAQAVLDKYQPQYVHKHGDILVNNDGVSVIYLVINCIPRAYCLGSYGVPRWGRELAEFLTGAKFLFNVNDRIAEDCGGKSNGD